MVVSQGASQVAANHRISSVVDSYPADEYKYEVPTRHQWNTSVNYSSKYHPTYIKTEDPNNNNEEFFAISWKGCECNTCSDNSNSFTGSYKTDPCCANAT
jgi:hypothetical protein